MNDKQRNFLLGALDLHAIDLQLPFLYRGNKLNRLMAAGFSFLGLGGRDPDHSDL